MSSASAAAAESADLFLRLVEACVHTVLHARGVYPAGAFARVRACGVAAVQARHPRVIACVAAALSAARPLLLRGAVEAVVLLLSDAATGAPREQYVFAVAGGPGGGAAATYADLETQCGAAVVKLALAAPLLPAAAPAGATTFSLLLRTHEVVAEGPPAAAAAAAGGGEWPGVLGGAGAAAWARVDAGDAEAALAPAVQPRCRSVPVKSVRAGGLAVDIWIEAVMT